MVKTPTPKTLLWEAIIEYGKTCQGFDRFSKHHSTELVACLDRVADCIELLERETDLAEIHRG